MKRRLKKGAREPVEQTIELPEGRLKLRVILVILGILVAAASMAYGLNAAFSTEAGVQEIAAQSRKGASCSDSFTFYYDLGAGETSATEERKELRALYTQAAVDAQRLFGQGGDLCGLSARVGETVTVDGALYSALSLLEESGTRFHYLAPVYGLYRSLFFASDDAEAASYDPYLDEGLRAFCREAAAFASDPEAVSLELLGEDRVRLNVSEEYLRFARENGVTEFVDLFWLENAFMADYIAGELLENGYSRGALISRDGFIRSLPELKDSGFTLSFSHREGNVISQLAALELPGGMSVVFLRDYPAGSGGSYHVYEDGTIRCPYVDPRDGLSKSALPELAAFSEELSCAETALAAAEIYIADDFDVEAFSVLERQGISVYYCEAGELVHTGTP